jgi:8-oxo-dGTP pyrophosphatase MutT (NUDIX family)
MLSKMQRRIFNHDDLSESKIVNFNRKNLFYKNSISAGGCLFYRENKQLLLIRYDDPRWFRLDDFGGKVDLDDSCILETISREVNEETNGQISEIMLKELLKCSKVDFFYNARLKYYNLLVKVGDDFFPDTTVFGCTESYANIPRTIAWYDYNEIRNQLSTRLFNNRSIRHFLDNL